MKHIVINPKRGLTSTTIDVKHIVTIESDFITVDDIYNASILAAERLNMSNF